MSVTLKDNSIVLVGDCGVEQAETLLNLIVSNPHAQIDISSAGALHTSLWQVMLMLRSRLSGDAPDAFIRKWVLPAFEATPNDGPT